MSSKEPVRCPHGRKRFHCEQCEKNYTRYKERYAVRKARRDRYETKLRETRSSRM